MKSAFVALVGRPSSGKSTLVNRLCGHKVSIVSAVPQTTRNRVRGILSDGRGQLVFVDTPGFHLSQRKMNLHLKQVMLQALEEVDLVLYLVDATRRSGEEEQALMRLLKPYEPVLLIGINKIDLPPGNLEALRLGLREGFASARPRELSALTGAGCAELLEDLWELAPEGPALYPQDLYTDQEPGFRIAEIVREKAIAQTRQEVPHALYVEISDMEMRAEGQTGAQPAEAGYLWVRGFLLVERESQKGILVGRAGGRIKAIVQEAQEELAGLFPYPVRLDLRVKTRPKWRKNDGLLKKLIQ